jgi:hypothetical protein
MNFTGWNMRTDIGFAWRDCCEQTNTDLWPLENCVIEKGYDRIKMQHVWPWNFLMGHGRGNAPHYRNVTSPRTLKIGWITRSNTSISISISTSTFARALLRISLIVSNKNLPCVNPTQHHQIGVIWFVWGIVVLLPPLEHLPTLQLWCRGVRNQVCALSIPRSPHFTHLYNFYTHPCSIFTWTMNKEIPMLQL